MKNYHRKNNIKHYITREKENNLVSSWNWDWMGKKI